MHSLRRRLASLQTKMAPQERRYLGTYEIHYLEAWPHCKDKDGFEQCEEHPPACGVLTSPTLAPGRQAIILRGGPWLGID